jgi:hypothetical protein
MARSFRRLVLTSKYVRELLADREMFERRLRQAVDQTEPRQILKGQSLTGLSAMGLLAKQAYDAALPSGRGDAEHRQQVAVLGGLLLFAVDLADDEIDTSQATIEYKVSFLDEWLRVLLGDVNKPFQKRHSEIEETLRAMASFDLARHLHSVIQQHEGVELLSQVMTPLICDVKKQCLSYDLGEQLELLVQIGGRCGSLPAIAVEIIEGTHFPEVRELLHSLGAYAQCINHAYEIQEDTAVGSPSYATTFLSQFGDTPANRRQVKSILTQKAELQLSDLLGSRQRNCQIADIVFIQKILIDLKYKVLRRYAKPMTS